MPEVARRAKGLGMHVIARDPYAPADCAHAIGVELVSFNQAITTANFISLHMPLTLTASKILSDDTFAKMKKGVRIVNVAHGGVIDKDALVRALDAGIVAQVLTFSYLIHILLGAWHLGGPAHLLVALAKAQLMSLLSQASKVSFWFNAKLSKHVRHAEEKRRKRKERPFGHGV